MATKFIYTDTELAEIIAKYNADISLEVLAQEYNKSVASVRMKLVKQGVYKKAALPVKTTKATDTLPQFEKFQIATTKSGILAQFNSALKAVGPALL